MAGRTSSAETRTRCFVDFEQNGRQVSHLQLPHSSDASAYDWIGIPIAVFRHGTGPTVFLGAGNHGDECEGQITLVRLIRGFDPATIEARLIVLPASNLPAALAGLRCSPIDRRNLNRCFPGDPDGPPTAQIAHFIEDVLLPVCDAMLDFHSGGRTLDYLPSALTRAGGPRRAEKVAALRAFGAPIGHLVHEGGEDRTMVAAAGRVGILGLGTEIGGAGTATPATLAVARRGLFRFLGHLGVTEPPPEDALAPNRLMEVGGPEYYVHAPCRGLFEPAFALGDTVRAGRAAGWVHFVDDPARPAIEVPSCADGLAICKRPILRVGRGDCLAHPATDLAT